MSTIRRLHPVRGGSSLDRVDRRPGPARPRGDRGRRRTGRLPILDREAGRSSAVLAAGRRRIVEVGTAYGYSTLWLALGPPADATIVTIDPDRARTDLARGWWRRPGSPTSGSSWSTGRPSRPSPVGPTSAPSSGRSTSRSSTPSSRSTRPISRRSCRGCCRGRSSWPTTSCGAGRVSGAKPTRRRVRRDALRAFDAAVLADPRFSATILPVGDGLLDRRATAADRPHARPRPAVRDPARAGRHARGRPSTWPTARRSRRPGRPSSSAIRSSRRAALGPVRPERRVRRPGRRRWPTATSWPSSRRSAAGAETTRARPIRRILELRAGAVRDRDPRQELGRRLATPSGRRRRRVPRPDPRRRPGRRRPARRPRRPGTPAAPSRRSSTRPTSRWPMPVLDRIADEIAERFGVERLAIVHRTGEVPLGEVEHRGGRRVARIGTRPSRRPATRSTRRRPARRSGRPSGSPTATSGSAQPARTAPARDRPRRDR